jgi:hypothetical protein
LKPDSSILCAYHHPTLILIDKHARKQTCSLFVRLISHKPAVLFSQNKSATGNQSAVPFLSEQVSTSHHHQPNGRAAVLEMRITTEKRIATSLQMCMHALATTKAAPLPLYVQYIGTGLAS